MLFIPLVLQAQAPFMSNPGVEKANPENSQAPLGFPADIRRDGAGILKWTAAAARTGRMGIEADLDGNATDISWPDLKLDPAQLYRFSFWYKTKTEKPQAGIVRIMARSDSPREGDMFVYPSNPEWTRARIYFMGSDPCRLSCYVNAVANGLPEYKIAEGQKVIANSIALKAFFDDFELVAASEAEFKAENLLQNGNFESGVATTPGWALYFTPQAAIQPDPGEKHSGKRALRYIAAGAVYSAALPLKSGCFYYIALWLKAKNPAVVELHLCAVNALAGFWQKRIDVGEVWKKHAFIIELPQSEDTPGYFPDWNPGGRKQYFGEKFPARLMLRAPPPAKENIIWADDAVVKLIHWP